ncbi:hypothetical protein LOY93_006091 [Ophidiomyces ophidiicola]|nr:hypothetical protein LOY93_006091 [Ophidiomyces ophidiicola]
MESAQTKEQILSGCLLPPCVYPRVLDRGDPIAPTASESRQSQQKMPRLSLSQVWDILGPFQIGTREATWGLDPLETRGGFRALRYDPEETFPSAIGKGGLCHWSKSHAKELVASDECTKATLDLEFPKIDWSFIRSVYGWSGLQHQAWARGILTVSGPDPVTAAVYGDGVIELRIDGELYFGGDFYSYRRAPLILELSQGDHTIELRLVYDIRSQGESDVPQIKVTLECTSIPQRLNVFPDSFLIADVVDGKLASPYGSSSGPVVTILNGFISIAPWQSRPLAFALDFASQVPSQLSFEIGYSLGMNGQIETTRVVPNLKHRKISDAQKFTFLHPSGIVSYAVLRPPPNTSCRNAQRESLPLLIALHGAGNEADSDQIRHMLDGVYGRRAWILFPTGVTTWSGDDWHTWGFADVQAAVSAIPNWISCMSWNGPGASLDDWIVAGHSNGGQGAWYLLSHQPDKVIAAAPVSGYTSIENYVPFNMWRNMEASLAAVLELARRPFKHELLTENFSGIPILQQHGANDDNVPVYHSRLMHQLSWEGGFTTECHEIPGAGHWFDGIMTTPPLSDFYLRHTEGASPPRLPEQFSMVIPSSPDMGSRGGILVDQLCSPDRFGHMRVFRDMKQHLWRVKTGNIRRFHIISLETCCPRPEKILVDGSELPFIPSPSETTTTWYTRDGSGSWTVSSDNNWRNISERYGRQVGTLDSILRTRGSLIIYSNSPGGNKIALQISRNLFQYFAADCSLNTTVSPCYDIPASSGNIISVTTGNQVPNGSLPLFPISIGDDCLKFSQPDGSIIARLEFEPSLGAVFLRPLKDERLELVVWGADLDGLQLAARLVPTLTGVGQPDFVVLGISSRWKGAGGVYAAGFFDHSWQISRGSYLP